jgi:ABC-2 type transport system permease protein
MFIMPCALLAILAWLFSSTTGAFNRVGPALLAIFPIMILFLVASIATLRERTSGTLERLLSTPLAKTDILFGYAIAFGLLAVIQAVLASVVSFWLLGLDAAGDNWLVVLIAVCGALLGMGLGLMVSAFAKTEFQAVQFLPVVLIPQLLLCGLFVPLEAMPRVLERIAHVMPMTYAVQAMQNVTHEATTSAQTWRDIVIILIVVVASIAFGALTLRRKGS